jgi:hypothetical protein
MVKILVERKSRRNSNSFSGIVHGIGGRHFVTFSLNSSADTLLSLRRASVSTSIPPISPI